MDPLLYAREHDLGAQKDKPSRSEAIRRRAEIGLRAKDK